MAQDQVDVMQHLGFERFFVAGHDRGARTAFRMALDHPDRVRKFASFDIIPTHHALTHISREWALNSYHWFFMAQPFDIPERLLAGNERYYIDQKLTRMGIGKGGFSPETLAEYARCCTAENLHAVCEDYRAGVSLDFEKDRADLEAGRTIERPTLVIWGAASHTEKMFDPRVAWPPYASNIVKFCPLPCGHYPAEQVPDEIYRELHALFGAPLTRQTA
jgi:haloacetate dehalogenase